MLLSEWLVPALYFRQKHCHTLVLHFSKLKEHKKGKYHMKLKKIFYFCIIVSCFYFSSAVFANKVHHYTLKNGLQLFVKVDRRAPVVISQVWYKVGSSYESLGITGISHALEHMMFGGTKKYSSGELAKIIAEHGGIHNAFTSYDYTVYYQELPAKDLELSFQLESDRMSNLLLLEKRFGKEKEVIKEERRLRTDNEPQAATYERFLAAANIASSYHHPVIGWMNDIQNLNVSDLRKWYDEMYAPNNAIIVVVGDVVPKQAYELVKKYFGPIKIKKLPVLKPQKEVPPLGKRNVDVSIPAKLPILFMGYNVPVLKTAKQSWQPYALVVLAAILDGGSSARLEKEIVRGKRIAANVGVGCPLYSRLEDIFVLVGVPNKNHTVDELKQAFLKEIEKLQTTLVSKQELAKVKAQVIAEEVFSKDSLSDQAYEIGSLESVGLSWRDGGKFVSRVEKITPHQVQQVAKKYLVPKRLTVTILTPEEI
jgi:zinc protease